MAAAAHQRAQRYSADRIVPLYEELYREVVG